MAILGEARAISDGGPFVFPGKSPEQPLSNMCFHMALRRMKVTDQYVFPHLTPHGFRTSFRTWAAEATNVPGAVAEAALANSVKDKTEAAYNRTALFEQRRDLMNRWATFATQSPGKVIHMSG